MPSAQYLALLRDTVRNHPVVVASTAATAGVLLGGFVAVQLLAPPHKTQADGATPPKLAVVEATPALTSVPKPVAETTGSAASGDNVATANCDQQTWPNLSRDCVRRGSRVVSSDKLHPPAVTAIESQPALAAPPIAPSTASTAPVIPAVVATAPPAAAAVVAPAAAVEITKPDEAAAGAKSETAARLDVKQKTAVGKAKRKPKLAVKPELKDDEDSPTVASRDNDDEASDDRGADRRAERRNGGSRRIVDRWTERDYDVDSEDGGGRRQVTVIRRNRSGGVFESLFGMGRDRDDDD